MVNTAKVDPPYLTHFSRSKARGQIRRGESLRFSHVPPPSENFHHLPTKFLIYFFSNLFLLFQHSSSQFLVPRHSSSQLFDRHPNSSFSARAPDSGMRPRSPFWGCVFIVLGGCEINRSIKLWGNCNGEPYLSSPRLHCSCPEIKGPWLNWHHTVLLVPTVAATVATPSLTDWVNSWPPQRIRKSNPFSLKMVLFSRTMHSCLF